jgi:hypothetical protein
MTKQPYGLEQRLNALEKRYQTIYQRFYVNFVRQDRDHQHAIMERNMRVRRLLDRMDHNEQGLLAIFRLLENLKRGRHLVTLDNREYCLLKAILIRRTPFRARKGAVKDCRCSACGHVWSSRCEKPYQCPRCAKKGSVLKVESYEPQAA